jgi:hypothetical protein
MCAFLFAPSRGRVQNPQLACHKKRFGFFYVFYGVCHTGTSELIYLRESNSETVTNE